MSEQEKGILGRCWEHLQGTQLRLWHMVLAFIVSTGVTTGVPLLVNHWGHQHEIVASRSKDLTDVAAAFENNVNNLINSGNALNNLSPASLAALNLNIQQQFLSLNKLRPVLSPEQKTIADQYAMKLLTIRDLLKGGITPDKTRQFGIAAQELVVIRDRFLGVSS